MAIFNKTTNSSALDPGNPQWKVFPQKILACRARKTKGKTNKWDYIKLKNFFTAKEKKIELRIGKRDNDRSLQVLVRKVLKPGSCSW